MQKSSHVLGYGGEVICGRGIQTHPHVAARGHAKKFARSRVRWGGHLRARNPNSPSRGRSRACKKVRTFSGTVGRSFAGAESKLTLTWPLAGMQKSSHVLGYGGEVICGRGIQTHPHVAARGHAKKFARSRVRWGGHLPAPNPNSPSRGRSRACKKVRTFSGTVGRSFAGAESKLTLTWPLAGMQKSSHVL